MKTQMVRLVALGREGSRHVYGTRRLTAGDEFEMRREVADILVRIGRAKLAPEPGDGHPAARVPEPAAEPRAIVPPPVSHETETAPEPAEHRNSIDDLREQAEALGVAVDGRWGVVRLQAEIARARRG